MQYKNILVTGGLGFIGSAIVRLGLKQYPHLQKLVNLDLMTYAANVNSTAECSADQRYYFCRGDINDTALIENLCRSFNIDAIIHCAAESHVDRSIADPQPFLYANICGTFSLLELVRKMPHIRFHHVSTDEVYGSCLENSFHEDSPYRPNSPYSATKAASDHLVRAWGHTYQLNTTISHCSNNYGPFQHEEKLIPKMIRACLDLSPIPIYGSGLHIRDWLFVDDHAAAIWAILAHGKPQETYDIGGRCEKTNLALASILMPILSARTGVHSNIYQALIQHVPDRPGHDLRYAINCIKIEKQLGWHAQNSLQEGLAKTIDWYLS